MASVIRLKPTDYIHVLDNNKNVTRVVVGPVTYTKKEHEKIVEGPTRLVMIPKRHYAKIVNPVQIDDEGAAQFDKNGNPRLRWGDAEIRFERDPFPLYPGEKLVGRVSKLAVIPELTAYKIKAVRDITNEEGEVVRKAGDQWYVKGPKTYYPRVEEEKVDEIRATVIKENQALRLKALVDIDDGEVKRFAGEEWLYRETGAYLPRISEQIIGVVNALTITETKAIHLRATASFIDFYKNERKSGEEWLITYETADSHIPDVYEQVVDQRVRIKSLNNRQYCVILNPISEKTKKTKMGRTQISKRRSFFLP